MAKIPFDIKYRPQIESGEYKVETRDGKPVRIVCWDRKDDYPIMALTTNLNKSESYISCYANGRMTIHSQEFPSDLFIVTPEPEPLTKLEKAVFDMLVERTNEATISEKQARKYAPIFLEIAKDEIYSHESLVEYAKVSREQGKAEALKDLLRWKKDKSFETEGTFMGVKGREIFVVKDGYSISVAELIEKLPGFKEDEK